MTVARVRRGLDNRKVNLVRDLNEYRDVLGGVKKKVESGEIGNSGEYHGGWGRELSKGKTHLATM